jgi:fatty acid desaturase
MRDRFTVLTGVVMAAVGVVWLLGMLTGVQIPWDWVLPGTLIVFGLLLVLLRSRDEDPPSQFERDDAPRVP